MNKLKSFLIAFTLLFMATGAFAQDAAQSSNAPVDMATGLYQSGKIYVVVIVAAIILIGILAYLIAIDRKVAKLEKEITNK